MIWRLVHRHPRAVDVLLVAFLLFGGVGAATHRAHERGAAIVLAALGTLPLLERRRRPVAVTLAVTAVVLVQVALAVWVVPLQLAVALFTLTSLRDWRETRLVAAGSVVAVAIAVLAAGAIEFGAAAARVVFLVAAAFLGDSVRSRRAEIRAIEERAERAAALEQARIARELHDVIAHALSVIVVQAGAAEDAFEFDPVRAREPIHAIDSAARAALADLRRVLGIIQAAGEYEPQPGLGELDRLVDSVRATGLEVTLEVDGQLRKLPAAVDLSAYRIVQEALTNSLKHAQAEHVRVRVSYGDELELEIRDDGQGATNGVSQTGNGLVGMRERVALLGGRLEAGPDRGGGYRVAAQIPVDSSA